MKTLEYLLLPLAIGCADGADAVDTIARPAACTEQVYAEETTDGAIKIAQCIPQDWYTKTLKDDAVTDSELMLVTSTVAINNYASAIPAVGELVSDQFLFQAGTMPTEFFGETNLQAGVQKIYDSVAADIYNTTWVSDLSVLDLDGHVAYGFLDGFDGRENGNKGQSYTSASVYTEIDGHVFSTYVEDGTYSEDLNWDDGEWSDTLLQDFRKSLMGIQIDSN